MKLTQKEIAANMPSVAKVAIGLATVAFAAGLVTPVRGEADVVWGTTYLNPEGTMAVCVCDGGTHCTPCLS